MKLLIKSFVIIMFIANNSFAKPVMSNAMKDTINDSVKNSAQNAPAMKAEPFPGIFFSAEKHEFYKIMVHGRCYGSITYPQLKNSDDGIFLKMNEKITRFAKRYAVCNTFEHSDYNVDYVIHTDHQYGLLSIKWITKHKEEIQRIDVKNFNLHNGQEIFIGDIFNSVNRNMLGKIIDMSSGAIDDSCDWNALIEKIKARNIQFYLDNKDWRLVFNVTPQNKAIVDIIIPKYFLNPEYTNDKI